MKTDFTRTPNGSQRIIDNNLKALKAFAIPLFTDSPDLNDNPDEPGYIRYHAGIIEVYNGVSWASQTLPAGGTNLQYLRGDKTWQTLNTSAVPENTNLYYTDARVQTYSDSRYLQLTGGVLTGDVQNATLPVNANSYITRGYLEGYLTGITWKQEVKAATTANVTLSGTQTIDGVDMVANDRILVKNQTTQTANGIYIVQAGAWVRSTDADTSSEIGSATVLVRNGTVNKNTQWTCTNTTDPVIGTDNITFGQISGAGTYVNGSGIILTGNSFSLDTSFTDGLYPRLSGSYGNPTWITSLDYSKITGKPTTIAGYGITDAYTKTESDTKYTAITTQDVIYPSDFPFKPFQIYQKLGKFYPSESNYDRIKAKIPLLRPYYVDYANGSGSNSGLTPSLALKTVASALSLGAKLIYVAGNQIYKIDNFGLLNNATGDDVIIISIGGKAIFSAADTGTPTWTLVSGTTYSTPLTLTNRVVDTKYQNKYGFYTSLVNQTTLAACQATPGTNYIDQVGNIVYVNLSDGRVPDASILLLKKSTNFFYRANTGYLYVENVQFMGGNGAAHISSISGTTHNLWGLFKNCDFIYGGGLGLGTTTIGEGFTSASANSWLEDCRAFGNDRDGLNYLSDGKIIEVNCESHDNGGLDGTNTVNGSSAHAGVPVLRINGKYYNNFGPNVIDVQTLSSSPIQGVAWCLGVEAFNSLGQGSFITSQFAPYGDFATGDINNLGLYKMYLTACISRDTRQAFGWTPVAQGNIIVDAATNYIGSVTTGVTFGGYTVNDSQTFVFPNTSVITPKVLNTSEGGTGSSVSPTVGQFLVSASAGSYAPTNTLPAGTLLALKTNLSGTDAAYVINLSNGDNITLPAITANRTVTFPSVIDGKIIYIWNMNNSAFTWSISGTVAVKNPALATMSTITNQTYTAYIGSSAQTAWIRLF